MGMNETPSANRIHIGLFGRRNAGKSSLINAMTGQDLAIVSNIKGTTTDPVQKAMELLPLGPVVLIDTPGLDDTGELGAARVRKAYQTMHKTDLAILVIDGAQHPDETTLRETEQPLLAALKAQKIPCVIAVNKSELLTEEEKQKIASYFQKPAKVLFVSAKLGRQIKELKEHAAHLIRGEGSGRKIIGDFLNPGDIAVLVIPIDASAPKGRLILPQQQVIRDCLEAGAIAVAAREHELQETLRQLAKPPKIVITDSQAFERAAKDTPGDVYLTSFSILFSRYKGNLIQQAAGAKAIRTLKEGDVVLISEGCTHHRQCEDIGTVKLPRWLLEYTGKNFRFAYTSGNEFPQDLSEYALVIHCGGCTLNEREMQYRLSCAKKQGVPMTNYGTAIAEMHGILDRSLALFYEDPQEGL